MFFFFQLFTILYPFEQTPAVRASMALPVKDGLIALFLVLVTIIDTTCALPSWIPSNPISVELSSNMGTSTEDCTVDQKSNGFCDSTNNNEGCGE